MVKQHIFLSPHLDDAVLSCGGILAQLTKDSASVSVITIFAGMPDPSAPVSAFAQYQHDMWGNPEQAYDTRRAEDSAALVSLNLKPIWLDFFDCIYRGSSNQQQWYYNSDKDIFGALHASEVDTVPDIISAILQAINAHPATEINAHDSQIDSHNSRTPKHQPTSADLIIYSPLTVGRHVDHQLTFLAALQLMADGHTVRFYEEFPYVDRDPANLNTALYETGPMLLKQLSLSQREVGQTASPDLWKSEIHQFSKGALTRKIDAIAAYQTQLEVLFGGAEAMAQRVTMYARHIGQNGFGERLWRLKM